MKKMVYLLAVAFASIATMTSCHGVRPEAGEEAVLIYKPWFIGHGGVDMTPVETGLTWCVWSTSSEIFKIIPQKQQVDMEDLVSNDKHFDVLKAIDFPYVKVMRLQEFCVKK